MNPFQHGEVLWNFMNFQEIPKKSDLIFVACSHELRVADHAAKLYLDGYAGRILFSGGTNWFTEKIFTSSEAETFRDRAVELGVDRKDILIETNSTNSGENILYSKNLLSDLKIPITQIIAVQKPSMLRRLHASISKQWKEISFLMSGPDYGLYESANEFLSLEMILHEIVGDFERLITYPFKGFQIQIEIPEAILESYKQLISMGYTKHLSAGSF